MHKEERSAFKDTIIIMTSNAGTGKVEANVGFGAARERCYSFCIEPIKQLLYTRISEPF